MHLGVVEISILKQFKKPLLITCRSSMNNVKVRSLCMCNKREQNKKFINVVEVSNYSRYRLQAVVKVKAVQALVFQNPGVCKIRLHLEWELVILKAHLMFTDLGCTVLSESRTKCSVAFCSVCTVCSQWSCQHWFSSSQVPIHTESLLVEYLTPLPEDREYWWNKSTWFQL